MIRRNLISFAMLILLSTCLTASAWAHNQNNGYSYIRMSGHQIEYELLVPFPLMLAYDTDGNKMISEGELTAQRTVIQSYVMEHLLLFNNEQQMEGRLSDLSTIIQEQTEDPMVRLVLSFDSPMTIGNLTILYNLFFNDVDSGHQNYIQLYNHQELAQHWVVEQGSGPVRYLPDRQFRFDPTLMGTYVLFGAQSMLYSVFCWLLLLFLIVASGSMKETAQSLAGGTLYSLLGLVAADRLAAHWTAPWLHPLALTAFGIYVLYIVVTGRSVYPKVISALFGLAWGSGSLALMSELHLNNQFKVISLVFCYAGVVLAWLGLMYVLYILLSPMLRSSFFGRRALIVKSLLAVTFLAETFASLRM